MLNRNILAILGLIFSSVAAAGSMGVACVPGSVTVPCVTPMWDLGVQALYLKPIYDAQKSYGIFNNQLKKVDNDWGWGYRLEGSYHFNTGNDVTLSWIHYDVTNDVGTYLGAFPIITPFGLFNVPSNFNLDLNNRFDQVNLVLGQHVDMGAHDKTRIYAGFQYANIKADAQLRYNVSPLVFAATDGVSGSQNSDFNGVGPIGGIDYSYNLTQNFSINANVAGSILYGSARYTDATFFGNSLVITADYASKKAMVPSLEGKLGASFDYAVAQGFLNIEAGYYILNYFNALQNFNIPQTTIVNSDFGLNGPYFGIKWIGYA